MNDQSTGFPWMSRRGFLKCSGSLAGGATVTGLATLAAHGTAQGAARSARTTLGDGAVVLFQGDSITDAGRDRSGNTKPNMQGALGSGYAWLAAAQVLVDHPQSRFQVLNRGISGNKVFQLADRWETDCLALKPDLVSILIGVNDIWHALNGEYRGTVEVYERDYRMLLERTRKALPTARLVVCEPFVLRCGAVNDKWFPEFDSYRAAARRVATAFKTTFVPFQAMFDEALNYAEPEHWAKDGVHPTLHGASLMAHFWLQAVI